MDSKLDNVWQLMREFDFQFDRKLPADLICVLCKIILIDARVSSCGCRFCKKCIERYLATGDVVCPGHPDESEVDEMLNLETNVSVDHFTNRKIAKLRMKCPIEMCPHTDQMINLVDHVELCRKFAVKCPYSHVGCNCMSLEAEFISHHITNWKDGHIGLMMSLIETVVRENESMKQQSVATQTFVNDTQLILGEQDLELNGRARKIAKLDGTVCQCKDHKKEVDELKYRLGIYLESDVREFTWKINNYAQVMRAASSSFGYSSPFVSNLFGTASSVIPLKSGINRSRLATAPLGSITPTKINLRTIYSDEFSVDPDGTKMQLFCYYDNSSYHVCAWLVTGRRNPYRPWPIKCNVTLGIINETSGQYFRSMNKTFEYTEVNKSCESFEFTKPLMDNIATRDITVKCSVKMLN